MLVRVLSGNKASKQEPEGRKKGAGGEAAGQGGGGYISQG